MKANLKILSLALAIVLVLSSVLLVNFNQPTATTNADNQGDVPAVNDVLDDISELFFPSQSATALHEQVYLGGFPIGMTIDGNGVTVVGLNEYISESGEICCPAVDAGIIINDVVVELNGIKIYNSTRLSEIAIASGGKPIEVKFMRKNQPMTTTLTPIRDLTSKQYRLGLWTKDSSSGIGTLTYIRKDLKFGSLGHPICDNKGNIVETHNGGVYNCKISNVVKGQRGTAGELRGGFNFDDRVGGIYSNSKYGVFGSFDKMPDFKLNSIDVAPVTEVKPGKAYIYSTLDDNTRKMYEIEIVKANMQRTMDDKGMVIRVTDAELLAKSGGIVQGMSGSPIVQNGKLVGAVTHVFVNDPTKGYGMYAEWMLQN
jgi:stage IV sporulation protein B